MKKNNSKKIYIVLTHTYSIVSKIIKSITKEKYSHISISLDEKCNKMYSFGRKYRYFALYGVFKKEDLKKGIFKNKNSIISIYELSISKEKYDNIVNKIKTIEKENKGYNIIGLLLAKFKVKLHRKKYYCSEFVYEVLSSDDVGILNKEVILFKPEEIVNNINCKKIYEGKIRDFIKNL